MESPFWICMAPQLIKTVWAWTYGGKWGCGDAFDPNCGGEETYSIVSKSGFGTMTYSAAALSFSWL
jgi:hypothetical protein